MKNEETRLDTLEMKGLSKTLRVSWTAKKTNEWVLNKAGVDRELLDTVKARMLAYYGHTMRKQESCLEKQIMQGTMLGARGEEDHAWPGWTRYDTRCYFNVRSKANISQLNPQHGTDN